MPPTQSQPKQKLARRKRSPKSNGPRQQRSFVLQDGPGADLPGAKASALPATITPQLATLVPQPPAGSEWLNEIKLDGYRMLCRMDRGKCEFISRNDLRWTSRLKQLVDVSRQLPVRQAFVDGEVVVMTREGKSDFQQLQNAMRGGLNRTLVYCVFDLLFLDGYDLRDVPLEQRKKALAGLFANVAPGGQLRYVDHIVGHASEFFREVSKHGLEGIVCKRRDSRYGAGRSVEWLKVKCTQTADFVVGGYTKPDPIQGGFGALLLGHYDDEGNFLYAGRVGTGFSSDMMAMLRTRLDKLINPTTPFKNLRGTKARALDACWVKPKLIVEVRYLNRTEDGHLRHTSFVRMKDETTR